MALRDYESRIITHADELLRQLQAFGGKPFNGTEWFHFFTFDVMADLAFGAPFGMLKSGEKARTSVTSCLLISDIFQHEDLKLLQVGMAPLGFLGPIPWLFSILGSLPLPLPQMKFFEWTDEQMEARKKVS